MALLISYHICCHLSTTFKNLDKRKAYWFWHILNRPKCSILQWWHCRHVNVQWLLCFTLSNINRVRRGIFTPGQIFRQRLITKYHVLFHFFVHLAMSNWPASSAETHIWISLCYILLADAVLSIQSSELLSQFLSLKSLSFRLWGNLLHKVWFHSKYWLQTEHTWHLVNDSFLNDKAEDIV